MVTMMMMTMAATTMMIMKVTTTMMILMTMMIMMMTHCVAYKRELFRGTGNAILKTLVQSNKRIAHKNFIKSLF